MEWENKILINSLKFQKSGKSITSVVKKIRDISKRITGEIKWKFIFYR